MRTIAETISALPTPASPLLPAPLYTGSKGNGIGLAVASMRNHTTDEGYQIFHGLCLAGYRLCGRGFKPSPGTPSAGNLDETDVKKILDQTDPGVVVVQDKREWNLGYHDFRDPNAKFHSVGELAKRPDVFTLTILKDAHQRPDYHRQSAEEMGVHSWITYYHPAVVKHLAPYVRQEHLVRTYHSINAALVPDYSPERKGCLLSGAVSGAYPLRTRLFRHAVQLPETTVLRHPGYHRDGCATPEYLKTLAQHKVAICTSSIYGYALRKLMEATACGCAVITDLPFDEILPEIDDNLIRILPTDTPETVREVLKSLYASYDPERQRHFADKARFYDFRIAGERLAADIERMRLDYV